MGCDIHLYRERRVNGQWESADKWTPYSYSDEDKGAEVEFEDLAYTGRNYNLFAVLAGVRMREEPPYHFEPRGVPLAMSKEVAAEYASDGGHTPSHLYLHELLELRDLIRDAMILISGMKDKDQIRELADSVASGKPQWDLLYPYCQGTTDSRQVKFQIDVPAAFIVGDGLDTIIKSLEGIGGDMQRIVFWFDN